jgi:hypothetical protein
MKQVEEPANCRSQLPARGIGRPDDSLDEHRLHTQAREGGAWREQALIGIADQYRDERCQCLPMRLQHVEACLERVQKPGAPPPRPHAGRPRGIVG